MALLEVDEYCTWVYIYKCMYEINRVVLVLRLPGPGMFFSPA